MADLLSNSTVGGVSISENLHTDMTSYIVEQGSSGTWSYIKYSNGFIMCWGTASSHDGSVSGRKGEFTGTLPISFSSSTVFSSLAARDDDMDMSLVSGTISGNTLSLIVEHLKSTSWSSEDLYCQILVLGYA